MTLFLPTQLIMAKNPTPDSYLDFVLEQLAGLGAVTARSMMGGKTLSCDGTPFALIARGALYLKVDAVNLPTFTSRNLPAFQPDDEKPGTMSYHLVPADVLEDRQTLTTWAREALEAGRRSATKRSKKQRPPGGAA